MNNSDRSLSHAPLLSRQPSDIQMELSATNQRKGSYARVERTMTATINPVLSSHV
jgi:hypothetical protein